MAIEVRNKDERIQELLEANNAYQERYRAAERNALPVHVVDAWRRYMDDMRPETRNVFLNEFNNYMKGRQ